ncbi:MAG: hypothetical protein LBE13_10180 [Bacteroidales bacterium]|jgi:Tat protein secretion system quality control protein TatD with DNase activity|nr:hypothetical protein [Bacteroidales bacterium]
MDASDFNVLSYEGMHNKSAYIPVIAQRLAEIKQTTIEEVAKQTTQKTA